MTERMFALEIVPPVDASPKTVDRPTIPVPHHSEIRLAVRRVPWPAATIDIVTSDSRRDPRSESFVSEPSPALRPTLILPPPGPWDPDQNESPPSTSTVRALK
jgi:hypothetical protein